MRQVLSVSLSREEIQQTRRLAAKRGFSVVSDYVRFLVAQDDGELISEDEIIKRSKATDNLYKKNKLVKAKSMADFMS